ncbi:tripartite tricarboxylate transporter TctB family protein [Proteiniclasticum ruminis]|uniref:Tripartite tricarboxylate transporter TctB family protein n=1 Tax=Proteiniclasticum ruminis TaxID=398199 RepID=A0A1I5BH25_9CLOT|nr:tripartite tricarboxylate transporter TctB family protein [Proteiniclasticum ruminis]SFN73956.1 Tripartite tricarboxylate transporter TctB family protein [Proteiniclasticum ruminis]
MLRLNTKKILPVVFIALGALFMGVSLSQLGFWVDGPGPGFFPSIISAVMMVMGVVTFFLTLKDDTKAKFLKEELLVIYAGIGIFAGTFVIGFVPTILVYLFLWLRVFEKISWKVSAVIVAIAMLITMGVFGTWLGIQFPMGLLENFVG